MGILDSLIPTLPGGVSSTSTTPVDTSTTDTTSTTSTSTTSTSTTSTSTTSTSSTSTTSTTDTTTSTTDTSTSTTPTSSTSTTSTTSTSSTPSSTTSTTSTSTSGTSTTDTHTSTTSTTPGTSTTPLVTHTSLQTTTNGNGQVETITISTVVAGTAPVGTGATLPQNTPAPTHSSVPFLHNPAAVGGTFAAVGVIALIALFFAGTAFMRRRREQRYDDEADAAAAEAYKSAAGQQPYLDDDDDFPGAGRSAYTDHSGVSLAQPPLAPAGAESYGMREFGPGAGYAPDAASTYNQGYAADATGAYNPGYAPEAGAYGAAGLGAGAGANAALQRARSQKSGGSVSPYNAYANAPGPEWQYGGQQDPYATAAYPIPNAQPYGQGAQPYGGGMPYAEPAPQGASHQDLLASGGLDADAQPQRPSSAAIAAQQRGVALARSPSQAVTVHQGVGALHRNKSITLEQGFLEAGGVPAPSSAQVQYMSASQANNPYADVYGGTDGYSAQSSGGGMSADQHRRSHYESDVEALQPHASYVDDDVASVRSSDQPRVLRVANE